MAVYTWWFEKIYSSSSSESSGSSSDSDSEESSSGYLGDSREVVPVKKQKIYVNPEKFAPRETSTRNSDAFQNGRVWKISLLCLQDYFVKIIQHFYGYFVQYASV